MIMNNFEKLASIDVSKNIEKKQNMSYLSWAWAVDQLMRKDPSANWVFLDPITYPDGTMMVHCNVTAFEKTIYMWLPVMDHRNKSIQTPDSFQINKAMMRCLVKGIAVHGLGLYIYAGEDIPESTKEEIQINKAIDYIQSCTSVENLNKVINKFKETEHLDKITEIVNQRKAELGV
jgi:hypothetical protein